MVGHSVRPRGGNSANSSGGNVILKKWLGDGINCCTGGGDVGFGRGYRLWRFLCFFCAFPTTCVRP